MTGRELKQKLRDIMLEVYTAENPMASDHYKWKNVSIPIIFKSNNSIFGLNVIFPKIPIKNCTENISENNKLIEFHLIPDTKSEECHYGSTITSDKLYDILNRYPVYNDCEVYIINEYYDRTTKRDVSNLKYNKNSADLNDPYVNIQITV